MIGRAGVALLALVAGFMWAASAAHVRLSDALPDLAGLTDVSVAVIWVVPRVVVEVIVAV